LKNGIRRTDRSMALGLPGLTASAPPAPGRPGAATPRLAPPAEPVGGRLCAVARLASVPRVRRLPAVLVLGLLLVAAPAPALARLPRTVSNVKPYLKVRPAQIGYTGDGTAFVGGVDGTGVRHLGHLGWRRYTHRDGRARGRLWLDDCDPSCADGTFHAVPVSVHVWRPRRGVFRRLTLVYGYRGRRWVDRRAARHVPAGDGLPGRWDYAIVAPG
jgi:hypothetical protein